MTVYIELVIFNNFLLNLLLILFVQKIRHANAKFFPVFFATSLGTAIAVVYPLMTSMTLVVKLLLAPFMVFIFGSYKSVKEYLYAVVLFMALTFALGGVVVAISNIFNIEIGTKWFFGIILFAILVVYFLINMLVRHRASGKNNVYDVTVTINGQHLNLKGLADTGNRLVDGYTSRPVIVLSEEVGKQYLPESKRNITVSTVAGEKSLPLISVESLEISNTKHKYERVAAVISADNYSGYQVILNSQLF